MVIHRITGSKESVKLLYRTEADISYTDVFKQMKSFYFGTENSSSLVPKNIPKDQPTHVTIENSDGRYRTLPGFAATDDTNATIYVPKIQSLPGTTNCLENETINAPLVTRSIVDYEEYKTGKPSEPPLVIEYKSIHRDLIDKRLRIDCAMSVGATLTSKEGSPPYALIGSQTVFNTKILMLQLTNLKQDSY